MQTRVMVVDDKEDARTVVRDLLESQGFEVVGEAGNGEQAISVYQQVHPDILILDLNMPVMNGVEALRNIMLIDPTARVIVNTGSSDPREVNEAISLGAKAVLAKPFDCTALITLLHEFAP